LFKLSGLNIAQAAAPVLIDKTCGIIDFFVSINEPAVA
jgi:hypothetical protein